MSYKVNRSLGFQPWGVTNPWVWSDYGQPQRQKGPPSPMVFQTNPPYLKSAHLGDDVDDAVAHRDKMETIAMAGLGVSIVSLWFGYSFYKSAMKKNSRRRRRRR